MIGGLRKSASRLAIAATAGLFVGGLGLPTAKAADLGGDCCADLEERVAELEATTARKGNRKMSLTITGQVHRIITFWDDGLRSGTYVGLDNTNSSSRFGFLGSAKVTPNVTVGFDILIEIEAGGTSSKVNQFDEDGKVGSQIGGPGSFNASNVDSYFGDARRVTAFIEHKQLGRLTVGRQETAGVVNTIDLGGVGAIASSSSVLLNGGFYMTDKFGNTGAIKWGNLGDPAASQGRQEGLRYDSPSLAGFILSASVNEAANSWGAMLRYAGEFSGVRVAAGIGWERVRDFATLATIAGPTPKNDPGLDAWGGSLAFMHVPTGLFLQGHYMAVDFNAGGLSGYWGQANTNRKDANQWMVQGGIAKNWFGLGNTVLYGEYIQNNDWGAGTGAGINYTTAGFATTTGLTDTGMRIWGLGIVQNLDAAATEIYLGYRNYNVNEFVASGVDLSNNLNDFHQVTGGMRVKF
ncbi:MAG: hypothetical protein AB7K67_15765 [Hyphomicrobiaceae bacterium]